MGGEAGQTLQALERELQQLEQGQMHFWSPDYERRYIEQLIGKFAVEKWPKEDCEALRALIVRAKACLSHLETKSSASPHPPPKKAGVDSFFGSY